MAEFLNRLQNIDRRILYVLVVIVVSIPFLTRMMLPIYVTPPVQKAYDAVEKVGNEGKLVVLICNWEPGTRGESGPQTTALIRHMFKKNIKFAIFGHNGPVGHALGNQIAEENAPQWGKKYGVDWIDWGYRPGQLAMIQGLAKDIRAIVTQDVIEKKPIDSFPIMRGVHNFKDDVGLVIDVSPSWTIGVWIQYVHGRYKTPLVFSPTAVMVAETYPWLASGQLAGSLPGLRGAAEYENLIGVSGYGIRAMNAQSMAHVLIIALIVLGNIGYLASRRKKGREQ